MMGRQSLGMGLYGTGGERMKEGTFLGGSFSVGARSGWASNHRAETGDQRGCAETRTAAVEEPCGLGDTRENAAVTASDRAADDAVGARCFGLVDVWSGWRPVM